MFKIEYPFKKSILACGAQRQANFCLTKKNCGFVVNNLGSLEQSLVLERYQHEIERLRQELKINPKIITHDLDPQCDSTKYAKTLTQQNSKLEYFAVQHHHAHLASCLGENGIANRVIGVVFDGGELGEDGQIWGGEFFVGSSQGFTRAAHLKYMPLQQENDRTQQPWQLGAEYLYQIYGKDLFKLEIDFVRRRTQEQRDQIVQHSTSNVHSSSMLQLFDCLAAIMGLREKIDFEGQGAQALERIVNRSSHVANKTYTFLIKPEQDKFLIHIEPIIEEVISDLRKSISKGIISAIFHNTVIEITRDLCQKIREKEKIKEVILAGSLFQNKLLHNRLTDSLKADGFNIISHKHFSYNDNNISFGQAILANEKS